MRGVGIRRHRRQKDGLPRAGRGLVRRLPERIDLRGGRKGVEYRRIPRAHPRVAAVDPPSADPGAWTLPSLLENDKGNAAVGPIRLAARPNDGRFTAVWLQQFREGYRLEGKKVSFNDLMVKAVARTLSEFPRLNSAYEEGRVRQLRQINIGVAVDAPQGLVVPVIQQADGRTIEQIAAESARLIDAAQRGRLGPDDLSGGTFTISNLGMFGVSRFTAIINPPQVAILAVGAIEKRVVALDNDAMAVRPGLTLTLAADHRVIDGALAARFLGRLREVLETPGLLG